jgi:hypothetical protein
MNEVKANKALVCCLYDEGINRHDAEAAAKLYSVDAKNHGHEMPPFLANKLKALGGAVS